jgi:hypothetical protein
VLIFKEMFENNDVAFLYVAPGISRGNMNISTRLLYDPIITDQRHNGA